MMERAQHDFIFDIGVRGIVAAREDEMALAPAAQRDDEPGDAFGGAFPPLITLNNIQELARRQENGEAFGKAIILNRQQEGYALRKIALECVCHGRER